MLKPERFLNLFYECNDYEIFAKSRLHLHVLRIEDGDFALAPLYTELMNHSQTYVLSRSKFEELVSDISRYPEVLASVREKFKTPDENSGEGGELLLYSFLEGHLQAPKILSKMELKTSAEMYVNGADGVHLLEVNPNDYQLIFGESKMYGDTQSRRGSSLKNAIEAAFNSMAKTKNELFKSDSWLVESQLMHEVADPDRVQRLAALLLPTARGENSIRKSNAFGVFLGFEVDVVDFPFEDHSDSDIEAYLKNAVSEAVESQIETIQSKTREHGLGGHHFHIYAMPFLKRRASGQIVGIQDVRMKIAEKLSGRPPAQKTLDRIARKVQDNDA
ncbi:HamA C-terminal domain-containing protein [Arthrobacter woluwensis]|uniref:HamA C-terminal domain-containing protein n=1 Tax=Arthrobacter woluwensis TaxID=156980 RepID=UPI001643BC3E|nr:DUF1837 domain-containing protein [Arthrobacter woluwensis]